MSKVESLFGGPVLRREVRPEVVEQLRDMLEMAEAGELVGFAGALQLQDNTTSICKVGLKTRALIGAMAECQFDMMQEGF